MLYVFVIIIYVGIKNVEIKNFLINVKFGT